MISNLVISFGLHFVGINSNAKISVVPTELFFVATVAKRRPISQPEILISGYYRELKPSLQTKNSHHNPLQIFSTIDDIHL